MKTLPVALALLTLLAAPASADVLQARGLELSSRDGLISVDWKDAQLDDALRLMARVGGVNLVLDPAVAGRTITLALQDVHWEQAMRLACSTHGFGSELEGNILRVAPVAKLTTERQQAAQLRQSREDAAPLVTVAFPLSWTDATRAEQIVRKALSPRGSTAVDQRTNTLIVTDALGSPALEPGFGPAMTLSLPTQAPIEPTHAVTLQLVGPLGGEIVSIRPVAAPAAGATRALASTVDLVEGRRIELPGMPGLEVGLERNGSQLVLVARAGRAGAHLPAGGRQAFALGTATGEEALLVAETH